MNLNLPNKTRCPRCKTLIQPLSFCPNCGYALKEEENRNTISLVSGHQPDTIEFVIGPYQILKSIGKGGMGEVFLAYDTICGRRIALKRIRQDLLEYQQVYHRFLREARITSQLTHPSIIPIHNIHLEEKHTYYTMPYVKGKTLKQLLYEAKEQTAGDKGEIPYLIRIFLSICQAIAYAHSQSVLHRDIKPENIIIGTYGEVLLLDWGLAKIINAAEEDEETKIKNAKDNTLAGKIVGTLGYMAPERALGQPATKGTDIYSLGVILYQILTLQLPFRRKNLKHYKKYMAKEVLQDPLEVSPYRDIPKILAEIALKCLSNEIKMRYFSVDNLIHDIETYIEGRAEWFQIATLSIQKKEDWEFQEHILIAEHTAITRTAEISEWVKLMISKASFSENIRIEAKFTPGATSHGIGILFNVPESSERAQINDGYCLWISTEGIRSTSLLKNSVTVVNTPDTFLKPHKEHHLVMEKIDNTIRFLIDQIEQFIFIDRMPLSGTHVGIMARDSDFNLEPLKIEVGSQNITVNCLAIPDAFLAHKDYQKALSEYRRIGYAFPGRAEGREAILKAGITLLEQGKAEKNEALYDAALNEFEKLHGTPGGPLEYLGKALVYEQVHDFDEEIKCFEIAYRRYPNHPLLYMLQDQILSRLIESSRSDRKGVYQFLLLALCHIPETLNITVLKPLIQYLKLHWESLDFLHLSSNDQRRNMILTLAFWTHKNYIFEENIQENDPIPPLILLIMLNEKALVMKIINEWPLSAHQAERALLAPLLNESLEAAFQLIPENFPSELLVPLLDRALDEKKTHFIYSFLPINLNNDLLYRKIWALLIDHRLEEARGLFKDIEEGLFHYLYGCYLFAKEGYEKALSHWNSVLEEPYPRSWTLGSHYLSGKLDPSWYKKAFDWERWQLQRQLTLFEAIKKSKGKTKR